MNDHPRCHSTQRGGYSGYKAKLEMTGTNPKIELLGDPTERPAELEGGRALQEGGGLRNLRLWLLTVR